MDNNKDESVEIGIDSIPLDVLGIIFDYLPTTTKVWLNKHYYFQYRNLIKSMIPNNRFNNYVIAMIRNDYAFVFEHIIVENKQKWFEDWINNKRYKHGNKVYNCFLYYVYEYSIEQNSNQCRENIEHHATELIGPKWHKKNRSSSFRRRWSN